MARRSAGGQAWADSLAWMRGFRLAAAGAHERAAALHCGLIRRAAAAAAPLGAEEAGVLVAAAAEAHAAVADWAGLRAWLAELQACTACLKLCLEEKGWICLMVCMPTVSSPSTLVLHVVFWLHASVILQGVVGLVCLNALPRSNALCSA